MSGGPAESKRLSGTPGPIRTADLLLRRLKISITYEHRVLKIKNLRMRALDPDGPKFDRFRRFGPSSDPPRWLVVHVLSRVTRAVAWPSDFLSKICCSDRIFKSPYRDGRATTRRRRRSGTAAATGLPKNRTPEGLARSSGNTGPTS